MRKTLAPSIFVLSSKHVQLSGSRYTPFMNSGASCSKVLANSDSDMLLRNCFSEYNTKGFRR